MIGKLWNKSLTAIHRFQIGALRGSGQAEHAAVSCKIRVIRAIREQDSNHLTPPDNSLTDLHRFHRLEPCAAQDKQNTQQSAAKSV